MEQASGCVRHLSYACKLSLPTRVTSPPLRSNSTVPAKRKSEYLTLPRPRLVCVLALLDEYERMGKDERKMTPCASETLSHLAVQLGSFKE